LPIPIAVGHLPSEVNASDFPHYEVGIVNGCALDGFNAQIIGYTGASIAYLRSESRFNPTESTTNLTVSSFPTSNGGENITFKMRVQSFSKPLTLGNSVGGYVRTFNGNPELTLTPGSPDNYCGWYVNNDTAFSGMSYTSFSDMPNGYLQVDEPVLQLGTYSSANYTFSILVRGPIAPYTAIDMGSDVAVTDFFPVSVAGQLQANSGPCPSILQ